jgi:polyisoprenoid-binding protein YceI
MLRSNSRVRRTVAAALAAGVLFPAFAGASRAAEFEVDRAHLSVHFAVSHFDISYVRGRFARIDAKVEFDTAARTGTVAVTVDPASIDTGNATLDGVLRGPQFLDAGQYAEIRYVSDRFVFDGPALTAVEGRLWLHGVQQPLRLVAERFVCKDVRLGLATRHLCGGALRAVFRRSTFGMTHMLSAVGDEVELAISVEATQR